MVLNGVREGSQGGRGGDGSADTGIPLCDIYNAQTDYLQNFYNVAMQFGILLLR